MYVSGHETTVIAQPKFYSCGPLPVTGQSPTYTALRKFSDKAVSQWWYYTSNVLEPISLLGMGRLSWYSPVFDNNILRIYTVDLVKFAFILIHEKYWDRKILIILEYYCNEYLIGQFCILRVSKCDMPIIMANWHIWPLHQMTMWWLELSDIIKWSTIQNLHKCVRHG